MYVWSAKKTCIKRICDASLCRIFILFFNASAGIFNFAWEWQIDMSMWDCVDGKLQIHSCSKCKIRACFFGGLGTGRNMTEAHWVVKTFINIFFHICLLSFALFSSCTVQIWLTEDSSTTKTSSPSVLYKLIHNFQVDVYKAHHPKPVELNQWS